MKRLAILCLAVLLLLPGLAQAKIFLADTDDTLQVVTASGVTTIHMYASWADITTTALTPGSSSARVTTATTTTLVASPGASTQRQIKGFSVRNNHASSSNAITVQFFDGTNATELIKYTLLAGETLQWGEDENFSVIDASGQIKSVVTANAGTNLNTSSLLTTTAHDAAFGTAGSADTQVRSVQGIASMTPLLVNPGTASNFGITNYGSAFPTPGTAAGFTDGTNMVAGRVVTSTPGTSDAGLVVRPINPNLAADNSANSSNKVPVLVGVATTSAPTYTTTNQVPLSLTTAGGLRVDGSAVTQPVSGTVTANAGTGNFTVTQATGTNLHVVCDSGCSSSSGFADNGAFTFGTTAINPIGGVFDDTSPNTATENSAAIARITQNKAIHTNLRNASGTEIGTSGNPIRTDPTGTTTQPVNVAQMNGVTVTMGNGTSGTGVQRVTLASDSTGTVAATQATAANLNVRPDTSGATGAAPPARASFSGGLGSGATGGFLTGFAVCDSFVNVNVSTAATTLLVTGVSGRHVRICGMNLVTLAANNVALISGTGATCGTGTTGMNGGTTAASGWNFAANSGLTQGNGLGTINQTNATGDSVCIVTSATTQLSGRIAYTIY